MTEPGIDEAFQRATPAAILAAGDRFVSRYLSWVNPATQGKIITPAERDSLLAAGVDIFLNWEFDAQDELGGAAAGSSQATEAVRQAEALGYPKGATIYFSGDFDETPPEATTVAAYFTAAGPIVRAAGYRVGAYGGYWYISRLFDAGLIDDGWQTYAWSGGMWDPRAALRQVQNGIIIGGANVDQDERVGVAYSWLHPAGGDVTPEEHAAVMNAAAFSGACIAGADTVWNYANNGSRTSVSMAAYWARIAAEVAKNPAGAPSLVAHTHTGGTTGPAVAG